MCVETSLDIGIGDRPTPTLPRIGEPVPRFRAVTTQGEIDLEEYRGRWLVLFSHPADFTPVCTTEFMAFAKAYPQFKANDCELLGLSVDSVYSHIAWIRNIEEKLGVQIPFPIIADHDKHVATLYGMIMPKASGTETARCVFVIDPQQVLRALIYYPVSIGRNVDEIVRLVQALQTADEHSVATPANWRPGDEVVLPPPRTQFAAERCLPERGVETQEWYLRRMVI